MKILLAPLLGLTLLLAPALAEARAGGGASFGSRGGRTYSAPPATSVAPYSAPIGRSLTPRSDPAPGYAPAGNVGGYAGGGYAGGGGFGRPSFASGFMGGLVGAGLAGLLFGHGLFGGLGGGGSLLGLLLQLGLLALVVRFIWRAVTARQFSFAGLGSNLGNAFARPAQAAPGRPAGPPLVLQRADYEAFERLLHDIQDAWSAADPMRLRSLATPEMVGMFGEQLAELASRGLRNTIAQVRLERGDLAEAWTEGSRQYATVAMRFSMTDVTRDARGYVTDGSPDERVTVAELWTFLRSAGGQWVLSAIQQAR